MELPGGFSDSAIRDQLSKMPHTARATFAASVVGLIVDLLDDVAERANDFDDELARWCLDDIWHSLEAGSHENGHHIEQEVLKIIPTEDNDMRLDAPWFSIAYSVSASIAYAAEVLAEDDPEAAFWAAEQVYDLTDDLITWAENIDVGSVDQRQKIAAHPALPVTVRAILDCLELAKHADPTTDSPREQVPGEVRVALRELLMPEST